MGVFRGYITNSFISLVEPVQRGERFCGLETVVFNRHQRMVERYPVKQLAGYGRQWMRVVHTDNFTNTRTGKNPHAMTEEENVFGVCRRIGKTNAASRLPGSNFAEDTI